jgi:hypothetical protein
MRVRLRDDVSRSLVTASLPITGYILHPESNRTEWTIVALDEPILVAGIVTEFFWLRPAISEAQVGDLSPTPVHVATVMLVSESEGKPVYKLGNLLGLAICEIQ